MLHIDFPKKDQNRPPIIHTPTSLHDKLSVVYDQ